MVEDMRGREGVHGIEEMIEPSVVLCKPYNNGP